jgi:hypothetical protein
MIMKGRSHIQILANASEISPLMAAGGGDTEISMARTMKLHNPALKPANILANSEW